MFNFNEEIARYFNNQNIRHAYLLETKDFNKIMVIIKKILLEQASDAANVEYLIDNEIYPDLKIIQPDGQWIKKEQILFLKEEFKVKSSNNGKRIYVIKNAENLNNAAANTMLKFLEEPEDNIIAILVTNNRNKVLKTLVSRCQYILLDSAKNNKKEFEESALAVYNMLEESGREASHGILKLLDKYDDRNEIKYLFAQVLDIYEYMLLRQTNVTVENYNVDGIFDKNIKDIKIVDICQRMNGLIFAVDALEYNVNLKLLVDKLLIMMFGVD